MIVFALWLLAATPEADVVARKAFEAGRTEYELGHFAEALKLFEQAYALRPLPGFLFNLGQCHHQLGDDDRAVFFYERYLEVAPKATNRAVAEELLEEARTARDARAARLAPAVPAVAPVVEPAAVVEPVPVVAPVVAPAVAVVAPAAEAAPVTAAPPVVVADAAKGPTEAAPGSEFNWAWIGVGVGGVAVAAVATVAAIAVTANLNAATPSLGVVDRSQR